MLDSIPVPFQAILYPLAGGTIILTLGRVLPNSIRRLIAAAAAMASLAFVWSLRTSALERVQIPWEPLNFFRMGPALYTDSLSVWGGSALAAVAAGLAFGVRGSKPQKATWHGLMLFALAGCLITTMAANLLTLALGSALIDLALVGVALLAADALPQTQRTPLTAAVPGIASTLALLLSALQMDTQAGHASLVAQNLPGQALILVGVAGMLRLLVFPLHPRGWDTPQGAATLLLPVGVGIYLLIRVAVLAGPLLTGQTWMLVAGGVAVLAGGLLAWSGTNSAKAPRSLPGFARLWTGTLVHQAGCALVCVILLGGGQPRLLLGLMLPLAVLVIWWDGRLVREAGPRSRWLAWLEQSTRRWRAKVGSYAGAHLPIPERWLQLRWSRYMATFLATFAVASLAGAPLTTGARVRWPFYATLLKEGQPLLLLVVIADTFLIAGLWSGLGMILRQAGDQRPAPTSLLAMAALITLAAVLGIAPNSLDGVGLRPLARPSVSVWGLGFVFMLPWLVGTWLARMSVHLEKYLDVAWHVVNLDWLCPPVTWLGRRLIGAAYWLGRVGEGEGWWGWALIVLALGIMFVMTR